LPQKFQIDKRKLHLSALILCGNMSRLDALKELEKPIYPLDKIQEDIEYVIKKLGIYREELETILKQKPKTFLAYKNSYKIHLLFRKILNGLRKKKLFYS